MVRYLLFSKLVNRASRGKVALIPNSAICLAVKTTSQALGNINMALDTAKSLGCMVNNIKAAEIMQKNQQAVLAFVWEVILVCSLLFRPASSTKSISESTPK